MSDSENKQMREIRKLSENRLSVRLKRRLSSMLGGPEEESDNASVSSGRVFEVLPAFQENEAAASAFHSVGTEGLNYTSLEVKRLSLTSTGTRGSETPTPTIELSVTTPVDLTALSLDPPKTSLKTRPRSMLSLASDMKRSSIGYGDYATLKRSSVGEITFIPPAVNGMA